jgi:hypothetical protein
MLTPKAKNVRGWMCERERSFPSLPIEELTELRRG